MVFPGCPDRSEAPVMIAYQCNVFLFLSFFLVDTVFLPLCINMQTMATTWCTTGPAQQPPLRVAAGDQARSSVKDEIPLRNSVKVTLPLPMFLALPTKPNSVTSFN